MKNILLSVFVLLMCIESGAQPAGDAQDNEVQSSNDSTFKDRFILYPGFGLGLVRNDLSPSFHINIGFNHRERYEANINTTSYFFFEKGNDNRYNIHRNTFLNAEFLLNFSPLSKSLRNWNGVGIGYLIEARGGYFTESAMVLYYRKKYRFFSITPGLIFDDNFKDVWPVISIRL